MLCVKKFKTSDFFKGIHSFSLFFEEIRLINRRNVKQTQAPGRNRLTGSDVTKPIK